MELKQARTSADYSRIEQLGLKMAEQARAQRLSSITDYAKLEREWRLLELGCHAHRYDIFEAWRSIETRAYQVRLALHWFSAAQLDTPGDAYAEVAVRDAAELREKNAAYGESWKRRGGIGAFMMLARKWDRLDNILAPTHGGSHMELLRKNPGDVLDDIGDLRRYLLLVEDEVLRLEDLPHHGHANEGELMQFFYVNHKDEGHTYLVRPLQLVLGSEHYPNQWCMRAAVVQRDGADRAGERHFALDKLHVGAPFVGSGG